MQVLFILLLCFYCIEGFVSPIVSSSPIRIGSSIQLHRPSTVQVHRPSTIQLHRPSTTQARLPITRLRDTISLQDNSFKGNARLEESAFMGKQMVRYDDRSVEEIPMDEVDQTVEMILGGLTLHGVAKFAVGFSVQQLVLWIQRKNVHRAYPVIGPLYRAAFARLPDSFVLNFGQDTLKYLQPDEIQEIMVKNNVPKWKIPPKFLLKGTLRVGRSIFFRLSKDRQVSIVRHIMRNLPNKDAARMFLDLPKNSVKMLSRKYNVEEKVNAILHTRIAKLAVLCFRDTALWKATQFIGTKSYQCMCKASKLGLFDSIPFH